MTRIKKITIFLISFTLVRMIIGFFIDNNYIGIVVSLFAALIICALGDFEIKLKDLE